MDRGGYLGKSKWGVGKGPIKPLDPAGKVVHLDKGNNFASKVSLANLLPFSLRAGKDSKLVQNARILLIQKEKEER